MIRFMLAAFLLFWSSMGFCLQDYEGRTVEVVTLEDGREVSASCLKNECLAKTIKVSSGDTLEGEDPAAVACISKLEGSLVLLHDGNENQSGFCRFSDGSILSLGSIRSLILE